MTYYKLVSEEGRFALKDNSMIFCGTVWLCGKDDVNMYHLIEDNSTVEINKNVMEYLVECKL